MHEARQKDGKPITRKIGRFTVYQQSPQENEVTFALPNGRTVMFVLANGTPKQAAETVELAYGDRAFRLRIRDDGKGIPPEIMEQGRSGHYGLQGMRERAKQTGAKLDIWSKTGAGTEIELTIAGSIAYRTARGPGFWGRFQGKGNHA